MSIFERHPTPWKVEYDNDVGPNDDGFWEWWDVQDANGAHIAKCDSAQDANDLCEMALVLDDE